MSNALDHPTTSIYIPKAIRVRRGRDSMVVVFKTIYAISAYHHLCCEFESNSWRGVLDTTLYDKVGQSFDAGRWFYQGTLVSSGSTTYLLILRE
jgi:hypothetical protein